MTSDRCPKDDPLRSMDPNNVFEVACPKCGEDVEFISQEKQRKCRGCGEWVPNPNLASEDAG